MESVKRTFKSTQPIISSDQTYLAMQTLGKVCPLMPHTGRYTGAQLHGKPVRWRPSLTNELPSKHALCWQMISREWQIHSRQSIWKLLPCAASKRIHIKYGEMIYPSTIYDNLIEDQLDSNQVPIHQRNL